MNLRADKPTEINVGQLVSGKSNDPQSPSEKMIVEKKNGKKKEILKNNDTYASLFSSKISLKRNDSLSIKPL